mmetsp:Transcript_3876/g.6287  ORF Transcript_3876/g.6287 Transcript_3876/m.6287 type:complete len:331 (-) Transcript_3876:25-1017(-)
MACPEENLDCMFEPLSPFESCARKPPKKVHRLSIDIDGRYFDEHILSFANASRLTRAVFRPNSFLETSFVEKKNHLKILQNEKFIAIHIRRGDSAWEKGNWLPIHSFLQSARRVASQKNMKKPYLIYVATDTADVVDLLKLSVREEVFRLVIDDGQLRYNISETLAKTHSLAYMKMLSYMTDEPIRHTLELLTDIMMMWRAEAFVGTLNSNIGRTVAELRRGDSCHFLDIENNLQRLRVSDTDLSAYATDDGASSLLPVPAVDDPLPSPLAAYWPSFFGIWPAPESAADDRPRNPLWWWRSILYGRKTKYNQINERLLEEERQIILKAHQ